MNLTFKYLLREIRGSNGAEQKLQFSRTTIQ